MQVERLDHLVLTVADIAATLAFYVSVMGMEDVSTDCRFAVKFGSQKINVHPSSGPIAPHADKPTPGSADLCFITTESPEATIAHLQAVGVEVELGPVARKGALGPMTSVYFRDPDRNLIEFSVHTY